MEYIARSYVTLSGMEDAINKLAEEGYRVISIANSLSGQTVVILGRKK